MSHIRCQATWNGLQLGPIRVTCTSTQCPHGCAHTHTDRHTTHHNTFLHLHKHPHESILRCCATAHRLVNRRVNGEPCGEASLAKKRWRLDQWRAMLELDGEVCKGDVKTCRATHSDDEDVSKCCGLSWICMNLLQGKLETVWVVSISSWCAADSWTILNTLEDITWPQSWAIEAAKRTRGNNAIYSVYRSTPLSKKWSMGSLRDMEETFRKRAGTSARMLLRNVAEVWPWVLAGFFTGLPRADTFTLVQYKRQQRVLETRLRGWDTLEPMNAYEHLIKQDHAWPAGLWVFVSADCTWTTTTSQRQRERESQQNGTMDTDTCIYQQTAVGPGGQGFKLRTNLERQYWGICNDYCRTRSPKAALNMQWRCSMLQRWMSL